MLSTCVPTAGRPLGFIQPYGSRNRSVCPSKIFRPISRISQAGKQIHLKNWQRHQGNPIIPNGPAGSWDERFASDPCVLLDGSKWAFFYCGFDRKGKARDLLALAGDPFRPVKVNEILIDAGPSGSVDSTFAHKPSVVWHEGVLYHFYCAVSGKWPNEVRGISVARARPW